MRIPRILLSTHSYKIKHKRMEKNTLLMVELVVLWTVNGVSRFFPPIETLQYTLVSITILYTLIRIFKEVFPKKSKINTNE